MTGMTILTSSTSSELRGLLDSIAARSLRARGRGLLNCCQGRSVGSTGCDPLRRSQALAARNNLAPTTYPAFILRPCPCSLEWVIDARQKGNTLRFANHSTNANCRAE